MNFSDISPVITDFLKSKGVDAGCVISLAGSAGSQRIYYRLQQDSVVYIIMLSPDQDGDFGRFLRLTQFYRLVDFPVPRVFCIDDYRRQVLLEDLGGERFYDSVRNGSELIKLYEKAIDILIFLQTSCFQRYQECPDIFSRIFGTRDLLWETRYFRDEYLHDYLKGDISPSDTDLLESEFSNLAHKVDSQPKTIMHRDYQSQNIMNQNGRLRVIDYQGSRLGSIYYDLASLLLDPYIMLEVKDIKTLFNYYHSKILSVLSPEEAFHQFCLTGSQRVMQALGAYCFLSRKKSLKDFNKYIEPGEARLKWVLENAGLHKIHKIIFGF